MLKSWLPITRIKILGATVLYKATTLFTGKQKRIVERGGAKYEVDLTEGIELSMFLFGKFQRHITENPFLKLNAEAIIIDIGANVGLMSLQFAQMAPRGRVYAFEPTHYAIGRLRRNLSLNPDLEKRVFVINAFVSARSDTNPGIVAYSSWKVNGERSAADHPVHLGTPKSAEGVPAVSLNDFVEREKLSRIDLIKIDTDGHEYEVFQGADRVIAQFRPRIIFEIGLYVMAEKKISFDFYFNYFEKLHYKLIDTKSGATITLQNYKRHIPQNGSTDLIAIPL